MNGLCSLKMVGVDFILSQISVSIDLFRHHNHNIYVIATGIYGFVPSTNRSNVIPVKLPYR